MIENFDCVEFQRRRRLELSREYNENKNNFLKKLKNAFKWLEKERAKGSK